MKSKEEIKNMVAKRRYGKKWEDILSKEQLFDEVLEEYAHQSGPSESSSEGVSKIREVMNWISQCVDEDHNLEVSEIKMIWNDLSDAISLIESSHVVSSGEGMAEALTPEQVRELYASETGEGWMVTPVCHGEKGFASWDYQSWLERKLASLSSPGSGWVKVEDGLPEIPPPYFENGLKLTPLGCRVIVYDSVSKEVYEANYYDGHFDDNNPDITHWQPLPTPPGVEGITFGDC